MNADDKLQQPPDHSESESPETSPATPNRRQFMSNLVSTAGISTIGVAAALSPTPASAEGSEQMKSKLVEQIKKDMAAPFMRPLGFGKVGGSYGKN